MLARALLSSSLLVRFGSRALSSSPALNDKLKGKPPTSKPPKRPVNNNNKSRKPEQRKRPAERDGDKEVPKELEHASIEETMAFFFATPKEQAELLSLFRQRAGGEEQAAETSVRSNEIVERVSRSRQAAKAAEPHQEPKPSASTASGAYLSRQYRTLVQRPDTFKLRELDEVFQHSLSSLSGDALVKALRERYSINAPLSSALLNQIADVLTACIETLSPASVANLFAAFTRLSHSMLPPLALLRRLGEQVERKASEFNHIDLSTLLNAMTRIEHWQPEVRVFEMLETRCVNLVSTFNAQDLALALNGFTRAGHALQLLSLHQFEHQLRKLLSDLTAQHLALVASALSFQSASVPRDAYRPSADIVRSIADRFCTVIDKCSPQATANTVAALVKMGYFSDNDSDIDEDGSTDNHVHGTGNENEQEKLKEMAKMRASLHQKGQQTMRAAARASLFARIEEHTDRSLSEFGAQELSVLLKTLGLAKFRPTSPAWLIRCFDRARRLLSSCQPVGLLNFLSAVVAFADVRRTDCRFTDELETAIASSLADFQPSELVAVVELLSLRRKLKDPNLAHAIELELLQSVGHLGQRDIIAFLRSNKVAVRQLSVELRAAIEARCLELLDDMNPRAAASMIVGLAACACGESGVVPSLNTVDRLCRRLVKLNKPLHFDPAELGVLIETLNDVRFFDRDRDENKGRRSRLVERHDDDSDGGDGNKDERDAEHLTIRELQARVCSQLLGNAVGILTSARTSTEDYAGLVQTIAAAKSMTLSYGFETSLGQSLVDRAETLPHRELVAVLKSCAGLRERLRLLEPAFTRCIESRREKHRLTPRQDQELDAMLAKVDRRFSFVYLGQAASPGT